MSIEFLYVAGDNSLVRYRVYEVDHDVYLVHTRNKRDFYGKFYEEEFYIGLKDGEWKTEPEQEERLVKELIEIIQKKRKNNFYF